MSSPTLTNDTRISQSSHLSGILIDNLDANLTITATVASAMTVTVAETI